VEEVFRALADPSRRQLLDRLFERDGQSLTDLAEGLAMTRFGVMKHLGVLEGAGLVAVRRSGREKLHYLNPVPIQLVFDRWVSKYAAPWTGAMAEIKRDLEGTMSTTAPRHIYETYIRTTPDALWRALTDPDETMKYFYGTRFQSSLAAGAQWACIDAEGTTILDGEVIESEPERRLVLSFRMLHSPDAAEDAPSRVTWEIEPQGAVCLLRLSHEGFAGETATYRMVQFGWNPVLSGLKTLLETGQPLEMGA
jgi:uncharacterized protein YndB with AHSA1/START domain/DNA-binding transcriptional ArsR family regulator